MVKKQAQSCSAGFTLIEIMIALALTGFIGFMAFNSLYASKNVFKRSMSKADTMQKIRYTMSTISKDIQNVLRSSDTPFVGVDQNLQLDDGRSIQCDYISFPVIAKNNKAIKSNKNGLNMIKFFLDYGKGEEQVTLKRVVSSDNLSKHEMIRTLCNDIRGLNFRYLKNNKWHDEWKRKSLPSAVEITIEIETKLLKLLPKKLKTVVSIVS